MNWKEFFAKFLNSFLYIFKILFSLATIIGFFFFFRWVGVRGLVAFLVGMLITAYLILSKNMILQGIIAMTSSESYIDELVKKPKNGKKK